MQNPWVEKYRPKHLSDVVHHKKITDVLRASERTGDLPHLLFHGPPGTGKTSTILALARGLFGDANVKLKERVLELNASDERGLDVVRHKIKTFSKVSVSPSSHCPPIKLVILDEADTMTPDAQSALRRTMETQSASTRFCLVCNHVSKILDPLASRCAKFRFSPLSSESTKRRLLHICEMEGVIFETDSRGVLDQIIASSAGDMRKSVNLLQAASQLPLATPAAIVDISGDVPAEVFDRLWFKIVASSSSVHGVVAAVRSFISEGYAVKNVLLMIQERVVASTLEIAEDADKALVCRGIMEADRCLNDGADEELQLLETGRNLSKKMDPSEMFSVLKTCIIGESFRACGFGYDPEDALETYHASEFLADQNGDDVTGSFHSPEHFLEDLCRSDVVEIYQEIRAMEKVWVDGDGVSMRTIRKKLWELGSGEAFAYFEDFCDDETARWFLTHGGFLFK